MCGWSCFSFGFDDLVSSDLVVFNPEGFCCPGLLKCIIKTISNVPPPLSCPVLLFEEVNLLCTVFSTHGGRLGGRLREV